MSTFREYCRVARDVTVPSGVRYKSLRYAAERYTWLAHASFGSVFLDLKRKCGFQVGSVNSDSTLSDAAAALESARSTFIENLRQYCALRRSEKRDGRRFPELNRASALFSNLPLGVPMPGSPAHADGSASWVELHDSEVIGTTVVHGVLRLELSAYVHIWTRKGVGTGWTQPVGFSLDLCGAQTKLPSSCRIVDGSLETSRELFVNLVPVPFYRSGGVTLRLMLGPHGDLEVKGSAIALMPSGSPVFVERLPPDLRP